ncbi:MAG: hypothetical protein ACYTEW_26115 [Planctomycetota bacterium]|jgi:hypothetical protein
MKYLFWGGTYFNSRENKYRPHVERKKGGEMFETNNAGVTLLIFILLFTATVFAASPINSDSNGVAIKGYNPVAYFSMDKPVIQKLYSPRV